MRCVSRAARALVDEDLAVDLVCTSGRVLSRCPMPQRVKFVHLAGNLQDERWMQALATCKQLRSIVINNCTNLPRMVGTVLLSCPQLQSADFPLCVNLTDASVEALSKCPQLQSVNFSCCENLTDAEALSRCPQLQSVNFSLCENLTDASVEALSEKCAERRVSPKW